MVVTIGFCLYLFAAFVTLTVIVKIESFSISDPEAPLAFVLSVVWPVTALVAGLIAGYCLALRGAKAAAGWLPEVKIFGDD